MPEIGTTLREARMRAHISIDEVEMRTKIRAKYLRAIENEEWDLLPGPVYAKSFLRTYGDFLGLDSRMLVDEFRRRYERPSDHELRPISALTRERERQARGPLLPPWILIVLVLVAVAVALFVVGELSNKSKVTPPSTAQVGPAHHPGRHRRPRTRRRPRPRPTTVKLQLIPTGTVYVCLVDATGNKLINQQIFAAGQAVPIETAPKLLLTLGNANAQVKVNGKPVAVTPSSTAIRLQIDPSGAHPVPLSTQPTCP